MYNSFVLLIIVSFGQRASSATCFFAINQAGYVCALYDALVTSETDVFVINGKHINDYSDEDINKFDFMDNVQFNYIPNGFFGHFKGLTRFTVKNLEMVTLNSYKDAFMLNYLTMQGVKTGMSNIPVNMFKDLNVLKSLDLENNYIVNFTTDSFIGLRNLESLNLNGNKLTKLYKGSLDSLQNLYLLTLDKNKIAMIEDGTFDSLPSLRFLTLEGNLLTELSGNLFGSPTSLGTFWLRNNVINAVDPGLISKLGSPSFNLQGNPCTYGKYAYFWSGSLEFFFYSDLLKCVTYWNKNFETTTDTTEIPEITTQEITTPEITTPEITSPETTIPETTTPSLKCPVVCYAALEELKNQINEQSKKILQRILQMHEESIIALEELITEIN